MSGFVLYKTCQILKIITIWQCVDVTKSTVVRRWWQRPQSRHVIFVLSLLNIFLCIPTRGGIEIPLSNMKGEGSKPHLVLYGTRKLRYTKARTTITCRDINLQSKSFSVKKLFDFKIGNLVKVTGWTRYEDVWKRAHHTTGGPSNVWVVSVYIIQVTNYRLTVTVEIWFTSLDLRVNLICMVQ